LDLKQLMQMLESGAIEASAILLTGMSQLSFHIAEWDPVAAWTSAARIAKIGRAEELGRAGWDSIAAALKGTTRRALRNAAARLGVMADVEGLPEYIQAVVLRCAREDGQDELFEGFTAMKLSPSAAVILDDWGLSRGRASVRVERHLGPKVVP
jgi:hypothetical protein